MISLLAIWLPDTAHPSLVAGQALPEEAVRSAPYLRSMGPPPLRFRDAPVPPPDLVSRPVAGGSPPPATPATPPEAATASETSVTPVHPASELPAGPAPTGNTTPATPPPSLLPDEMRPRVRAEDFLPFFQFPTASGDLTVVTPIPPSPPAPGQPPPSSATYRQHQ